MFFILLILFNSVLSSDFGYYVTSFFQTNIQPGQPITYDTTLIQTSGFTTEFSNINGNTGLNGTIVTISTTGLYGIQVQMTWDIDGGLSVWTGPDIDSMTESLQTVGSSGFYDLFTGSFFVTIPSSNYKVAVCACTCNLDSANTRSHLSTDPTRFTRPTMIIRSIP